MSALTLDPLGTFPPLQDPGGLEWYKSTHSKTHSKIFYTPGVFIYTYNLGVHIKAIKNFYNIILFFNLTIDIRLYCLIYIN